MKYYAFYINNQNGEREWFDDSEENTIIVKANTGEEAKELLINMVDGNGFEVDYCAVLADYEPMLLPDNAADYPFQYYIEYSPNFKYFSGEPKKRPS